MKAPSKHTCVQGSLFAIKKRLNVYPDMVECDINNDLFDYCCANKVCVRWKSTNGK